MQYQQQKLGAKNNNNSSSSSGSNKPEEKGNNKKRKRDDTQTDKHNSGSGGATTTTTTPTSKSTTSQLTMPKILPGEKFSDFAARVDRELPLSQMKKSAKPPPLTNIPGAKEQPRTKHEKRLLRLQKHWREEEEKIKEREAAERDEKEAEAEDQLELWKRWEAEAGARKAKKAATQQKKRKKGKGHNKKDGNADSEDSSDDDPDPWAKLKKRDPVSKSNPFDVVQAPPQLKKPKEAFKTRGGAKVDIANVPSTAGSLRRREELAGERRTIVEEYRRLMAGKRQ